MNSGREVRQAVRRLRATPGFTLAVILTLSLGIGSTTGLFTILNAVVLRPLPYPDPERLVVVWTDDVKKQLHQTLVSFPIYRDWEAHTRSFSKLGFSTRNTPVTLTGVADPERFDAARASASMFAVLGATPLEGRLYTVDEERRNEPVVVLSQAFAERRYGVARNALSKVLELDGRAVSVIGVMPSWFTFTRDVRQTIAAINPSVPVYRVSTLEQRLDAQLATRRFQVLMLSLFASAALVLAAVGIYGLMRYVVGQRTREIGVRIAVGATHRQVMALVLREGLWLVSTGLLAGVMLALLLTRTLRTAVYGITVNDPLTFVIAPAILLVVTIVASVEPTWRALRIDPVQALRAE